MGNSKNDTKRYFTATQVYFKIQEKYLKNNLNLHLNEVENKTKGVEGRNSTDQCRSK